MSEQVPRPSDRLRRMASDLEKAVPATRAEQLAARAIARARPRPHARRRIAVVVTTATLALVVGLGVTSADTLPGDSLYPVSRAYEEIGARVGVVSPIERRLNEVIVLAERGDRDLAVRAAEEALLELGYSPDTTQPSLTPTTSTTEPDDGTGSEDNSTTPTTAPPVVTVDATPEGDHVENLRLAAVALLSNMQSEAEDLEAATAELAKALSGVTLQEPPVVEAETTTTTVASTTSTTVADTTTTTVPEATTTTVPGSTTTTEPEDEAGEGEGPIFLPPSP